MLDHSMKEPSTRMTASTGCDVNAATFSRLFLHDSNTLLSSSRPTSIQNIQFYGSRPSTSQGSDQPWRPRIYSLPKRSNSELRHHVVHDTPRRPWTENDIDELNSPTFSGDTISSDGINTPPRLSMSSCSCRGSDRSQDLTHDHHDATPPPPSRAPPPPPRSARSAPRSKRDLHSFLGYALPSTAVESANSLLSKFGSLRRISISTRGENAMPPAAAVTLTLPTFDRMTMEDSLVEDIFSELGYA